MQVFLEKFVRLSAYMCLFMCVGLCVFVRVLFYLMVSLCRTVGMCERSYESMCLRAFVGLFAFCVHARGGLCVCVCV